MFVSAILINIAATVIVNYDTSNCPNTTDQLARSHQNEVTYKARYAAKNIPVIAYAEVIGITIAPTVRSASAKLMMNMLET